MEQNKVRRGEVPEKDRARGYETMYVFVSYQPRCSSSGGNPNLFELIPSSRILVFLCSPNPSRAPKRPDNIRSSAEDGIERTRKGQRRKQKIQGEGREVIPVGKKVAEAWQGTGTNHVNHAYSMKWITQPSLQSTAPFREQPTRKKKMMTKTREIEIHSGSDGNPG